VSDLDLIQSDAPQSGLGLAYALSWWNEQEIQRATLYWTSNDEQDYWRLLWYNESIRRVYYLEYSL